MPGGETAQLDDTAQLAEWRHFGGLRPLCLVHSYAYTRNAVVQFEAEQVEVFAAEAIAKDKDVCQVLDVGCDRGAPDAHWDSLSRRWSCPSVSARAASSRAQALRTFERARDSPDMYFGSSATSV